MTIRPNYTTFRLTILLALSLLGLFIQNLSYSSASTPPTITEPANNASITDTSPKLSWSFADTCTTSGSCFRVEVSDSESFSNIVKSTYTNNTNYTPQDLENKKYFWRVKGKDTTNTWSDFSTSSFTIEAVGTTSIPGSSSPPSQVSPFSTTTSQTFSVSANKPSLKDTETLTVNVELAKQQPNSQYFIKGAFFKEGFTNYFGYTSVSGSKVKNSATYSSQLPITTDTNGNWSGSLEVSSDFDDSGFTGSGSYLLKIGRYSSSGSGPTWSNSLTINLEGSTQTSDSSSKRTTSQKSTTSSPKPLTSTSYTGSLVSVPQTNSVNSRDLNHQFKVANIAGISTQSASPEPKTLTFSQTQKQPNWWFIAAGTLMCTASVGLVWLKKKNYYPF